MEFCKVMEERNRMCDKIPCTECLLRKEAKELSSSRIENFDCDGVIKYYPQKAEEIIIKWSHENPLPPPPIYPTIGEVVDKLLILMNIGPRTPNLTAVYNERLTKEAADYFGIKPINEK